MLPRNVSELDRRFLFRPEKKCLGKERATDVTLFSAFPKDTVLSVSLDLPYSAGITGVSACIRNDADGTETHLLFKTEAMVDGMRFCADFDLAQFCGAAESGLFYWQVLFQRGTETFFSDTADQVTCGIVREGGRSFRLLVHEDGFQTPKWFPGGVMYHIFVDRFFRGSVPVPVRDDAVMHRDWNTELPAYAPVRGGEIENNDFFGGTLWGVAEKLDYLVSLGVTVLYLSPVFEAYSNHKYDTADYSAVDPMFGGEAALSHLLSEAGKRGIRVLLDGVFNHTGDDSRYFNKKGRYPTVGAYQSRSSAYASWYTFRSFPDDYECWWGIPILPHLNGNDPSLRAFLAGENGIIESRCREGIAGFRLDVADELPPPMLEAIRNAVKRGTDGAGIVIGEVWENAADKIAYGERRRYFRGRQLDSVMNYPAKDAIIAFLLTGDAESCARTLTELYASYPKCVSDCLMNLLDSHDTERILTVLGGGSREEMTQKERAAYRLTPRQYALAVHRLKLASLIQYTLYGVPSLYYGDEAGMQGSTDPFCRLPFPWGRENGELLAHYRFLGRLRSSHPALRDGIFRVICAADGFLLFERRGETETLLTAVNLGTAPQELPTGVYLDLLTEETDADRTVAPGEGTVLLVKHS